MNEELIKLIEECNVVEFKSEDCDGIYNTISAFSNTNGGCIIVGVEDKTKNIIGIDISDGKQTAIANKSAHSLGVQPDINVITIEGKTLLKIIVDKSSIPVQYKGKYYKRVGDSTQIASQEELRKLLLKEVSWDSNTNNCTLEDIDEKTVFSFIKLAVKKDRIIPEAVDYTLEEILTHLDLISDGKLTNASILLFGKNPQKLFRNAKVRIGLFKGDDETTIISDKEISGNLFKQISEVEAVLKTLINKKSSIKDFDREDIWDYPLVALREAVLNALIHREYSDQSSSIQIKIFDDKIWIYNTGELFGGLTLEQIQSTHHPSKSRNPLLMNVIFKAGYVEQFGTGIKRMNVACKKQGMPAPTLELISYGFVLTMNKFYKDINERQKKAIDYVVEANVITNSIYQSMNNVSRETSKRDLKKLVDLGIFVSQKDKDNSTINYKLNY